MDIVRTAVIGVGALGKHHLRWLNELKNSQLAGFYDTDPEVVKKYASEYNTTAFNRLEDMVGKVDAVSIVVPTTFHFEVASFFIKNGIHCLIEKPVTSKYEDALALQKLAGEYNVKVAVGHIERFNPALRALHGMKIEPSFIEAHRLAAFDPRGTDVAVVLDLMIHDIDLALSLIRSRVVDIQASAVAVVSEQADIANARLTFENGAVANLTASRISLHAMRKLRIFQKSGYYSLDLASKQADLYMMKDAAEKTTEGMRLPLGKSGKDLLYIKRPDDGQDMLGSELRSFLEAVINDSEVAVPLSEGSEALKIALEVKRIGRESLEKMLEGHS